MSMPAASGTFHARQGSGTSWLPDSSPVRSASAIWSQWMVSLDGAAFVQYVNQGTRRGDQQFGLSDWEVVMAMRPVGGGTLQLRAMTSLEPLTLGGSGYPELLQTGGTYRHSPLHDRQHPHDALMELAAMFEQSVTSSLGMSLYAGAVGEPALGPVAFMHRPSAANDPMAPIGHHWQDATHQSFGVVTLGLSSRTVKLEGSLFNPREADESHLLVDYRGAKLDSYSGRLSWAASHALIHGGSGASPHHHSSSLLAESNLEIGRRSTIFARRERVNKNGEELGFSGGDLTALYDIRSVVAGATRSIATVRGVEFAVGARTAVNFIPRTLLATYGTRTPSGFAVYVQVRPGGA